MVQSYTRTDEEILKCRSEVFVKTSNSQRYTERKQNHTDRDRVEVRGSLEILKWRSYFARENEQPAEIHREGRRRRKTNEGGRS